MWLTDLFENDANNDTPLGKLVAYHKTIKAKINDAGSGFTLDG